MAKQKRVNENVIQVVGMSVAGGALPNGFKVYVKVEYDYTGVTLKELQELSTEGSSIRVKSQTKLRALGATYLREHGIEAVEYSEAIEVELDEEYAPIKFDVSSDFESERGGPRDQKKAAKNAYGKMTAEERYVYLTDDLKLSKDQAQEMVYGKDGSEE